MMRALKHSISIRYNNYATVVEVLTDVLHHGMDVGEEGRQLTIAGLVACHATNQHCEASYCVSALLTCVILDCIILIVGQGTTNRHANGA